MNFSGIYQFGSITTKSGKTIKLDEIDKDKDGKISQQEFNFIQKELGLDTVEFIDEKQKGEKNVTDYEFVLWHEEGEMQKAFDSLCSTVATEFIGANAIHASGVLKELREFLNDFKTEYKNGSKSITTMSEDFINALPDKYTEIKNSYLDTK